MEGEFDNNLQKIDLKAQDLADDYNHNTSGFASPAAVYARAPLNVFSFFDNPEATYFFEMTNDSMQLAGLEERDVAIVDTSYAAFLLKDLLGSILVIEKEGGFTVRKLVLTSGKHTYSLQAAHPTYPDYEIAPNEILTIFGKVVGVIKKFD
ncbi:MAG TPA: hypothetical protein DCS93_01320 [Microscillaceae bacterium]|nr:hypothetical protein [Microscillaceae bacterium]